MHAATPGNLHFPFPVGKARLLHGDRVVALGHLNVGWSVSYKTAIHFDICARRVRFHLQLCRRGNYSGTGDVAARLRFRGLRLKLRDVQSHVSVDVRGNLGPLRNTDVFAVHEQKKWCGREKDEAGCHHSANHGSGMATATHILDRAQGGFFAADQLDVIYIDVEFSTTRHSPLSLSLCNRRKSKSAFRDHERAVQANVFENLEVDSVPDMRVP